MEKFIEQMEDILEVDTISTGDVLTEFEAWDSLAILSIIALADEYYGITLTSAELKNAKTVG
jgi:acyl carrier protein